jgi:chemotaxis protein MotB
MRRLLSLVCVLTFATAMMAGCCWTQRGAAIGGAAGAGTGAIWATNAGILSTAEGALVGLAAGGLAGALIGDQIDHMQQGDMKRMLDQKEKELAAQKSMLDQKSRELEDMQNKLDELAERLKQREKEIADLREKLGDFKDIKVRREGDEIILSILGETLYASGKAELTANGRQTLDRVMRIIRDRFPDREIVVRGHTDTQPIKYSGWKSNWELAAARSLGVLHYLMDKHGVKGENISAATYSKYRPVADNSTAEGRRENRRAEIVILPKRAVKIERVK